MRRTFLSTVILSILPFLVLTFVVILRRRFLPFNDQLFYNEIFKFYLTGFLALTGFFGAKLWYEGSDRFKKKKAVLRHIAFRIDLLTDLMRSLHPSLILKLRRAASRQRSNVLLENYNKSTIIINRTLASLESDVREVDVLSAKQMSELFIVCRSGHQCFHTQTAYPKLAIFYNDNFSLFRSFHRALIKLQRSLNREEL